MCLTPFSHVDFHVGWADIFALIGQSDRMSGYLDGGWFMDASLGLCLDEGVSEVFG